MSKRTTIKISELKAQANKVMRDSTDDYADGRRHIATFVEDLLMKADQYRGFGYLGRDASKPGNSFGIEFVDEQPKFGDMTRIEFF